MAFDNPRDPGGHFSDPRESEGGGAEIRLQPAPEVKTPGPEEWAEGCRLLGLDPETDPAEHAVPIAYPGDTAAERFFRLAAENGAEYDLSAMPRSYAAGALTGVFMAWRKHYVDSDTETQTPDA
jgi:hypothetical protein